MAKRARRKSAKRAKHASSRIPASKSEILLEDVDIELTTAICDWFCQGEKPSDLPAMVKDRFGYTISRERPYAILRAAALMGWLTFDAPLEYRLGQHLERKYIWLERADIVQSTRFRDVGVRAARTLLDLVRKKSYELQVAGADRIVHIGLAGGRSTRVVAEEFSKLLRKPSTDLPEAIVLHSMSTGAQADDPTTDPNTFFNYFVPDSGLIVEVGFNALHGPLMPDQAMLQRLNKTSEVREARTEGEKIHIVVTAAASWARNSSQFKKNMDKYGESVRELERLGCVADCCWQPLSKHGPIDEDTAFRAMTLITLKEMAQRIAEQQIKVLLVLGPTSAGEPRDDVLKVMLGIEPCLFTHLVADLETSRRVSPEYSQIRRR